MSRDHWLMQAPELFGLHILLQLSVAAPQLSAPSHTGKTQIVTMYDCEHDNSFGMRKSWQCIKEHP